MPRSAAQAALAEKDWLHSEELAGLRDRAEAAEKVKPRLDELARRLGVMRADVASLTASDRAHDQGMKELRAMFDKKLEAEVRKVREASAAEKRELSDKVAALEEVKAEREAGLASREDEIKRKEAEQAN